MKWLYSGIVLLACFALDAPFASEAPSADTDQAQFRENPCGTQKISRKLPSSGIEFIYEKRFNCKTGRITSRFLDTRGQKADYNQILEAEAKARQNDPEAKISRGLKEALKQNPDKPLKVIVWLTLDGAPLSQFAANLLHPNESKVGKRPKLKEKNAQKIKSQIIAFNREQVSIVTKKFRSFAGDRVFFSSTYAPVVGVRVHAQEVISLALMPEVDTLYLEASGQVLNQNALYAHRILPEWENSRFAEGRRIAVLENEHLEDNFFLNVAGYFRPTDRPIDRGHAQVVAGSIGSLYLSRLGSAPMAQLFSANSASLDDGDITLATDWVIDTRIDVTNLSWGGLEYDGEIKYRDRLYDYHTRYTLNSFVAAAGNSRRDFIASPALAWNVIAVGNIQTGPDPDPDPSDWSNDVMYSTSSWINPLNRNEKPNVAARGTDIKTISIRRIGYIPMPDHLTGTSNAAPFVTSTIALAMNRNPTLVAVPETAMATIMASAWNNVEGADDRPMSEKDGAGGIHSSAAMRVAGNSRSIYRYVSPITFQDQTFLAVPVQLTAGDRTRIAISWSAVALSLDHSLEYLQTDLDLIVYEGRGRTGRWTALSISNFNNVEIVDFVPQRTGWHTIAIYAPRLARREMERVGIAISQYGTDVGN